MDAVRFLHLRRRTIVVVGLVLLASVGLKVEVLRNENAGTVEADQRQAEADVSNWLRGQGFEVTNPGNDKVPVLEARRTACQLTIAIMHPAGFHREFVGQLSRSADQVFFVYRGELFRNQ